MTDPMNQSPAPGAPQTNHKAWGGGLSGALTTLALYALGQWTDLIPAPEQAEVQMAAVFLVAGAVGIVTGVVTHYLPNRPK